MAISGSQQAYKYALSGIARSGTTRSNYTDPRVYVAIAGVHYGTGRAAGAAQVNDGTLSISDILNETPNTCLFTCRGFTPLDGQAIVITIGSKNNATREFNGVILSKDDGYVGTPANGFTTVRGIDDTWIAGQRKISGQYTNTSASVIAAAVVPLGFTGVNIQAGLPAIDTFQFTNLDPNAVLTALAKRIGAYWFWDYHDDLHFFITDTTYFTDPIAWTSTHPTLTAFLATTDLSPVITRCFSEGGGVTALVACQPGDTMIPVIDVAWYVAAGGSLAVGRQRLTYTAAVPSGGGGLVGPGQAPTSAPVAVPATGAGLGVGVYQCAYTDVTAAGESLPSPPATVTTNGAGTFADPTIVPVLTTFQNGSGYGLSGYGGYHFGDTISVEYTYGADPAGGVGQESGPSPAVTIVLVASSAFPTYLSALSLTVTLPSDPLVQCLHVWVKNVTGGSAYKLALTLARPAGGFSAGAAYFLSTTGELYTVSATTLPAPNAVIPAQQQISLTAIAQGAAGTTGRNYYRTVVNGSQLKLVHAIADNVTLTYTDSTADGSLGANAPTSDTSGLGALVLPTTALGFSTLGCTFNPNGAATAANTASPVFTCAQYTFVAADVGAFLVIRSGTNWTPGSYQIVSVAGGAATVAGACATVASPTSGTWGVDYSQLATPRFSYTDLVIDAALNTKLSSAAKPVGPNCIGNTIQIVGGLGWTVQRVTVVSATIIPNTATCDKVLGPVNSTGGIGALGGGPLAGTALGAVIAPGATQMLLASTRGFAATGGWVIASQQAIRYTGISGNSLTGIPASGPGSILTAIPYNSVVTPAAVLSGIPASGAGSILYPILVGDPVHLLAQVDDLAAQAALSALLDPGNVYGGARGIVEDYLTDASVGYIEAHARGLAQIALRKIVDVKVTGVCQDKNCRSGRNLVVNLPLQGISTQTFKIQQVDQSGHTTALLPLYQVQAGARFSFEDLLRGFGGHS